MVTGYSITSLDIDIDNPTNVAAADTANILTTYHHPQMSHHHVHVPTMDIPNAAIKNHTSTPDAASYLHSLKIPTSYFWILEPSFPLLCNEGTVIFYSSHCSNLWFPFPCNEDNLVLSDLPSTAPFQI